MPAMVPMKRALLFLGCWIGNSDSNCCGMLDLNPGELFDCGPGVTGAGGGLGAAFVGGSLAGTGGCCFGSSGGFICFSASFYIDLL